MSERRNWMDEQADGDCLIFGVTGPDTPRLLGGKDQQ
jgi:hypothetical protein